jgi:hypothetical protein
MRTLAIVSTVSALAISACAPVPGSGLAKNDPGPFPENYEQMVKNNLNASLKDPYSVQELTITRPIQTSLWTGIARSGSVQAWATCVTYNAKNSFGAYVGKRSYTYFIREGEFVPTAGRAAIL